MQFPFKNLPSISKPQPKNCTVLKFNQDGEVVGTIMVGLTKAEAEGVARASNALNKTRGIKDYFRVKEESYGK